MRPSNMKLATSVAALMAFTACSNDAPSLSGVQEVHLAVVAGSATGGKPFTTAMSQEVTHTPVYSGDSDGHGSALLSVNHGQGELCWEMTVGNVTLPATASHIHHAVEGVRGSIVVGLTAPDAGGQSSGCLSGVDRAVLRDILTNPADYYVNVHNADYPAGAVRGQLAH